MSVSSSFAIVICIFAVVVFLAWSARMLEQHIDKRIEEEVKDQLSEALGQRDEAEEAKKRRDARKDWTPADWMQASREAASRGVTIEDDHMP
jgi:hypothetical protein